MGLALCAAGCLFTWVLWTSYQRASATRQWTPVTATVLSSQILREQATPNSPEKYRAAIRYAYQIGGQKHESDRIRRADGPTGDLEKATNTREEFTVGQPITCWVNPADPTFAILKHDTLAGLYSIWFPLLFVFGGAKMAWDAGRLLLLARRF